MYSSILSPDKKFLAYTAVSEESENSSLFEYELYVKNTETNKKKRLTNLKTNVKSPVFFHHTRKIAFLEYKNWPSQPDEYELMTVSVEGEEPEHIDLIPAIAVYYVLLLRGVTVYLQRNSGRALLPSFISIGLAVMIFISSFVVGAMTNPWYGLGLAIIALIVFACSLLLLMLAFIVKRIVKSF